MGRILLSTLMICAVPTVSAAERSVPDVAAPAGKPHSIWESANRYMQFNAGTVMRHYVEYDSLGRTSNGIFDREDGDMPGASAQVRWVGALKKGRSFLIEGSYRTTVGDTDYDGYLQTTPLTPYKTKTHNALADANLRGGLSFVEMPRVFAAQFIEYRYHFWMRDVGRYSEVYDHHALAMGLLVALQCAPRVVIEAEGSAGTLIYAHIDVPQVPLSEALGSQAVTALGVTVRWQAGERWGLAAGWRRENSGYGASAVANGYFEPQSSTAETGVQTGFYVHY